MILYVTPAEFQEMRAREAFDALHNTETLLSYCRQYLGCDFFHRYTIVVRRNVPAIPWLSAGVSRFEHEEMHNE